MKESHGLFILGEASHVSGVFRLLPAADRGVVHGSHRALPGGMHPHRCVPVPVEDLPVHGFVEKRTQMVESCGEFSHQILVSNEDDLRMCSEAQLSVSNSSSGRRWKLDHAPAVGDPTHRVAFGTGRRAFARDASRRVAFQRRMARCRGVVGLEVGELPLQITGIPAQHMIQEFSPHRPDQPFHKGV